MMFEEAYPTRRALGKAIATGGLGAIAVSATAASNPDVRAISYGPHGRPARTAMRLRVGFLIFPDIDQIDFTGPFEVLARMPDVEVEVVSKTIAPIKDLLGLQLTPTTTIDKAEPFDVLCVAGGFGQQDLMDDEEILSLIGRHARRGAVIFSVCTGALLCGAAGVLRGRQATTHWASVPLLRLYGATPVRARVVVDGQIITAAGVTSGLDGALAVVALLRGNDAAKQIQLTIQYAPNPIFHSGDPETASPAAIAAFEQDTNDITKQRERHARAYAASHP